MVVRLMAQPALLVLKKLNTVHHSALLICSGAFQTSPVLNLYVHCVKPLLYLIHEQLSLGLYFRILSHPHHLHTCLLAKHDILYENRPSCILNFAIRIRNMLSFSALSDIKVCPWLLLSLIPWNSKGISYIDPFKNFD